MRTPVLVIFAVVALGACSDSLSGVGDVSSSDSTVSCGSPGGPRSAWQSWLCSPDTHPNIPNVAYAGYRSGDAPLPAPVAAASPVGAEWKQFDVKADFGASGDGVTDDFDAFRQALAAAKSWSDAHSSNTSNGTGAVVTVPSGVYLLTRPLFVHGSRVVIRGTGATRADVVLAFNHSLTEDYATNLYSAEGRTNWSWDGGHVWFTPESENTYLSTVPAPDIGAGGSNEYKSGWRYGPTVATVAPARRGDRTIEVSNASSIVPRQRVLLRLSGDSSLPKHLAGGAAWADTYWSDFPVSTVSGVVKWVVQVESVDGTAVTLKQPLRFDLQAAWQPTIHPLTAVVEESGIEHVTVKLLRNAVWTRSNHHFEAGWNGIFMSSVVDSFVNDVAVINPEGQAIALNAVKNVTVEHTTIDTDGSTGVDTSTFHHAYEVGDAYDCLIDDFTIAEGAKPLHGIHVNAHASGNVWSRGTMMHGTFDSHRALPFENVHTQITMFNDGLHGGTRSDGPMLGARFVTWNVTVTGPEPKASCDGLANYTSPCGAQYMVANAGDMPFGAIVGVTLPTGASIDSPFLHAPDGSQTSTPSECLIEDSKVASPPNLYEAQRACRIGGTVGNPACPAQ
jgi:hypothetical protein